MTGHPWLVRVARRLLKPFPAWRGRRAGLRHLSALPRRLSDSREYEDYLLLQVGRSLSMRAYVAHDRVPQLVKVFQLADPRPAGERAVLCVGCRNQHELQVLRKANFADVVGIDLFSDSADIQAMDMHAMVFPNRRFDVIFACHSLEHAHDVSAVLSEFRRVARPAAVCVLEVPVRFGDRPGREDLQDFQSVEGLLARCQPIVAEVLFAEEVPRDPPVVRVVFRMHGEDAGGTR